MPAPSAYTVVREILTADINLSADAVLQKARARGVTDPGAKVRKVIYEVRGTLRKKAGLPATPAAAAPAKPAAAKPAPAAARTTPAPAPAAAPAPVAAPEVPDLQSIFANVNLVNKILGLVGSADVAKQVAHAVQACGGVEAFLQHVDLVAGLRTATAEPATPA